MKLKHFVIGSILLLAILYLTIIGPARERGYKRERAEIHLLNMIEAGVTKYLYTGGGLPTNWMSLSNAVNWELVASISEHNQLPPPTELYTVLRKPVDLDNYYHSVFLVRTKPCKWPASASGRWVLGLGFGLIKDDAGHSITSSDSNQLYRTWVPEDDLPVGIRSQLVNQQSFEKRKGPNQSLQPTRDGRSISAIAEDVISPACLSF